MLIAACVKWVDLRPEIDPLHATVHEGTNSDGFSAADEAAVEVALRLAAEWDALTAVVCAGEVGAEPRLRELLARGVDRVVRVEVEPDLPSHETAQALAPVLSPADLGASLVVCGDHSSDRGSGSVPGFLAHELGFAQALGLVEVESESDGAVVAVRRLDGGRRERLRATPPAVLSVEGSVAELRRASLAATLASREAPVERRTGPVRLHVEPPMLRPWRPPARVLPPPTGDGALERVVHLTGALVDRHPPRTVELDPPDAAREILDQLRAWGYLG